MGGQKPQGEDTQLQLPLQGPQLRGHSRDTALPGHSWLQRDRAKERKGQDTLNLLYRAQGTEGIERLLDQLGS